MHVLDDSYHGGHTLVLVERVHLKLHIVFLHCNLHFLSTQQYREITIYKWVFLHFLTVPWKKNGIYIFLIVLWKKLTYTISQQSYTIKSLL